MPHTESTTRLAVTLPDGRVLRFSNAFLLGREVSCEVQVIDVQVSRRHAEVLPLRGGWVVRDLQSSNGLFVDGERVDSAPITTRVAVTFGETGPTVLIEPEVVSRRQEAPNRRPRRRLRLTRVANRWRSTRNATSRRTAMKTRSAAGR